MYENIKLAILFLALLLLQVLVCNQIFLFDLAWPIVFVYVIIAAPVNFNKDLLLVLSFLLGFMVDICCDTPGVNSLCCTVLAALKKPMVCAYVQRDDETDSLVPTLYSMTFWPYFKYILTFLAVYALLYFSVAYFSVANILDVFEMTGASTLLSVLLILGIDALVNAREKRL